MAKKRTGSNDFSAAPSQSDGCREEALVRTSEQTNLRIEIRSARADRTLHLRLVCREKLIVIEVDGGQHAESKSDVVRDRYLREQGYRVLRYWNNDVLSNLQGVLEAIASELG